MCFLVLVQEGSGLLFGWRQSSCGSVDLVTDFFLFLPCVLCCAVCCVVHVGELKSKISERSQIPMGVYFQCWCGRKTLLPLLPPLSSWFFNVFCCFLVLTTNFALGNITHKGHRNGNKTWHRAYYSQRSPSEFSRQVPFSPVLPEQTSLPHPRRRWYGGSVCCPLARFER